MRKLSEHFSFEELTFTQVRDAGNLPSETQLRNLTETAKRMEEVRRLLGGKPIIITSGFRSALVNKMVGGSLVSAHMRGWAVDFICPAFGEPIDVAREIESSQVLFDQLIWEESWVHLSFAPGLRGQVLTKRRHGTYVSGLREEQKET